MSTIQVDASMHGGSIEVLRAGARGPVELALRADTAADIRQWFCFDVACAKPRELVVRGVSGATYPTGFDDYAAMVSFDGRSWSRAPTERDGDDLVIVHEPLGPTARYAYFAPYSEERLERRLRKLARATGAELSSLGDSAEGRPLYAATLGPDDAARTLWVIARQHPGETPASWLLDGLMRRLAREGEGGASLLGDTRLVLVPLVNPDGAAHGNMRTSATGANLNRCWIDPDDDEAPEIAALLAHIDALGADLFVDVHADEDCAWAFPAGCEGNPGYDAAIEAGEAALRSDLAGAVAEFVDAPFYDLDAPGEADLSCAANQIGERHGCVALTLELPIKSSGGGRVRAGWSPKRAQKAGERLLDVLLAARARLDDDDG
jgi:murein tripeptide amidase MpaA